MRLRPGQLAPAFDVIDLSGKAHTLAAYRGRPLLLQFYRFAGCPMCDLRLHDFVREYPGLAERGLAVLAFFHSSSPRLSRHFQRRPIPFPIIGDPEWTTYASFGVERSAIRFLLTALKPSFYYDWVRSMFLGFWGSFDLKMDVMPADVLIGPDGVIRHVHYGRDFGDHMSATELHAALD